MTRPHDAVPFRYMVAVLGLIPSALACISTSAFLTRLLPIGEEAAFATFAVLALAFLVGMAVAWRRSTWRGRLWLSATLTLLLVAQAPFSFSSCQAESSCSSSL